MKYSDLFRTAAAVTLSIAVAAVPAMAKNGNPKLAKPTSAGPKAKAPSPQAPRATTQKPRVSSVTAPRSNSRPTTSARRSSVNPVRTGRPVLTSKYFADPASGFKNSGQFRATVNNANNHGLDFWVLKDLMVNQGMSLGQAKKAAKGIDARPIRKPVVTGTRQRPTTASRPTISARPKPVTSTRPRPVTSTRAKPVPGT